MFLLRLIVGTILQSAIFGVLLLLPAGTLAWWRAWVVIGAMVAISVWSSLRLPSDLLDERWKPPIQKGQPLADKIVVGLFLASFVGVVVFIPLDVFRFRLLGRPGILVSSLGLLLTVSGCWVTYVSLAENAFAAPAVKLQDARRHRVIDTGVYGVVRHPMYSGGVLLLIGMPLWLESYAAALLASVPIGVIAIRILVEEEFLRRELKGYGAYAERVRYRLIPFLW